MPFSSSPPLPSRIRWRRGRVAETGRRGRDTLQLTVEVPDEGRLPALAYPSLVGLPEVGDEVLLNTTALAQGLGTGGSALVVAVPDLKVAYVMTDGGALPAAFSRTLDALYKSLVGVVTVGQAFGGDLEAVTVHTGLLAAKHVLDADLAVITQGPGNLGTGTPWGFSGVAAGEACNAVTVLGGQP